MRGQNEFIRSWSNTSSFPAAPGSGPGSGAKLWSIRASVDQRRNETNVGIHQALQDTFYDAAARHAEEAARQQQIQQQTGQTPESLFTVAPPPSRWRRPG